MRPLKIIGVLAALASPSPALPADQPAAAPWRLLIIGPPGSGKTTHASRLAAEYGALRVSSGELLREAAKTDRDIADTIAKGQLVDTPTVIALVRSRLAREDVQKGGFILDGFPRTREQAKALLPMLRELGLRLDAVIELRVPESELKRRILGRKDGRSDDNEKVFAERMRVYREQTEPVLQYLGGKVPFLRPDVGMNDPEAAYRNVKKALESLPKKRPV